MGKVEKLAVILIGLMIAFMVLYYRNNYFIDLGTIFRHLYCPAAGFVTRKAALLLQTT
jgi:hypothetical protein